MENMGVISRVDKPTNWCSEMIVVPKSDGSDYIALARYQHFSHLTLTIIPKIELQAFQVKNFVILSLHIIPDLILHF
jgi:hypothetical protein